MKMNTRTQNRLEARKDRLIRALVRSGEQTIRAAHCPDTVACLRRKNWVSCHGRSMVDIGLTGRVRSHEAISIMPNHSRFDIGSTSFSLLDAVRANDPQAWECLVEVYAPLVDYWARRADLAPEDRADLLQEVFRSVAANIAQFRRDRPGDIFRGWLWTITCNRLADWLRTRANLPRPAGGSVTLSLLHEIPNREPPEPEDTMVPGSRRASLLRAVEQIRAEFEDSSWRAFLRTVVDGLLSREAADELGTPPAAIRKAKSRVLQRLREVFGDLADDA